MKNMVCMNCHEPTLERFLDLGEQPNGNHFPSCDQLGREPYFPFAMMICTTCWMAQLEEFPPVEFMFNNHPYLTGCNMPVLSHFDRLVDDALHKYPLDKNSLVLDIGANDGTLLKRFRDRGMRVLGIDPGTHCGDVAKNEGVTVFKAFFNEVTSQAFVQLGLRPDLITATAVFYHLEDIHSFVRGLVGLMKTDTVFITQCVYLKDVLEKLQFDHFYHEHTMIHALKPLEKLFSNYGLRMLDVEMYEVHGGSFVLYVGRDDGPYETSDRIGEAISAEAEAGLNRLETYRDFSRRVAQNRTALREMLCALQGQGKQVYALGAPLKGSTLLNYCDIGPDLVKLATEVNAFKIGKFTPGTNIPIIDEKALDGNPDYYLLLSWNFLEYFTEKYSEFLLRGGKFIVPHPEVRVIGSEAVQLR